MGTPAFDTHQAIKRLTEAGADEPLAEAVVATVGAAVSGELATKADLKIIRAEIKALEQATKAEFETVRSEIRALEQRMTIRFGGMFIAAVGIMIGAMAVLR